MKLSFIKVERVKLVGERTEIHFVPGSIQFKFRKMVFSLNEHLVIEVSRNFEFQNIARLIEWVVYIDQSSTPVKITNWELASLLANDDVVAAIREKMGLLPVYTVAYEELFEREMAVV